MNPVVFKPHPNDSILKEPATDDPGLAQALNEYLTKFTFKLTVRLGPSYSERFKEFNIWCEERLGQKYKDWFLYTIDRDQYVLFVRDSKWATFLALTWVDTIV